MAADESGGGGGGKRDRGEGRDAPDFSGVDVSAGPSGGVGRLDRREGFAPIDIVGTPSPSSPSSFALRNMQNSVLNTKYGARLGSQLGRGIGMGVGALTGFAPASAIGQFVGGKIGQQIGGIHGNYGQYAGSSFGMGGPNAPSPSEMEGAGTNAGAKSGPHDPGDTTPYEDRSLAASLYENPMLMANTRYAPRGEANDSFARWVFRG